MIILQTSKTLLERIKFSNDTAHQYFFKILSKCKSRHYTVLAQPSHSASISTLHQEFNKNICVNQNFLDDVRLLHFIDEVTWYSTAHGVDTMSTDDLIYGFFISWMSATIFLGIQNSPVLDPEIICCRQNISNNVSS